MAVTLNASTTSGLEIASDTSGIVTLRNNGTDALSVSSGNLQFNSGYGSVATAYGCRAWVNFNGTGTVAIRASGNVSSITDNGVGQYTVNFTTAMPDANYVVVGMGMLYRRIQYIGSTFGPGVQIAGAVGILNTDVGTIAQDDECINVAIFR